MGKFKEALNRIFGEDIPELKGKDKKIDEEFKNAEIEIDAIEQSLDAELLSRRISKKTPSITMQQAGNQTIVRNAVDREIER